MRSPANAILTTPNRRLYLALTYTGNSFGLGSGIFIEVFGFTPLITSAHGGAEYILKLYPVIPI